MTFFVGQRVTMKEDGDWYSSITGQDKPTAPRYGEVYEIAKVVDSRGLTYLEFSQWPTQGWLADEFRPVVEPKTDISIFTAMLTPKKVAEPA